MKKAPFQNVSFLVAGDSNAAALTALELARQAIPTKLLAAPSSVAAGVAISSGITLDQSSFPLFLSRTGLVEATHLILFPSDFCEMALWLAAAQDAAGSKNRRAALTVFAAPPNAETLAALRSGVMTLEPQP